MKDELRYIGKKIVENDAVLARRISELIDSSYTTSLKQSGAPESELLSLRGELVRYFGEALYEEDHKTTDGKVSDWGRRAANFAIQYDVSLSNALRAISFYRTVIWDVFTEELNQKQFAAITMLDVSKLIDPLLDKVFEVLSEVYEERSNFLMNIAYSALEELSVPVVPIMDQIAVIPLIGTIDTNRAQLLMENSLKEGTRLSVKYLILDVSGVPVIDTMVADQLYKIISALKLVGIEGIITGIRPELAQTIIKLGINFSKVSTQATLKNALQQLGVTFQSKPF